MYWSLDPLWKNLWKDCIIVEPSISLNCQFYFFWYSLANDSLCIETNCILKWMINECMNNSFDRKIKDKWDLTITKNLLPISWWFFPTPAEALLLQVHRIFDNAVTKWIVLRYHFVQFDCEPIIFCCCQNSIALNTVCYRG